MTPRLLTQLLLADSGISSLEWPTLEHSYTHEPLFREERSPPWLYLQGAVWVCRGRAAFEHPDLDGDEVLKQLRKVSRQLHPSFQWLIE